MKNRKGGDESAAWIALLIVATTIAAKCMGCSEPPLVEVEPEDAALEEDELVDLIIEAELEHLDPSPPLLPRPPEVTVAPAPPVIDVSTMAPPAYRDPRWLRRCQVESRRETALSVTEESKDVARERARALARAGELDELLILARIAYGETGTPRHENDDPRTPLWDEVHAFLAVLDRRRGSMSRVEMFVSYSPRRVFPHPEDTHQRWVAELELNGRRPASWPSTGRWHQYPPWRTYGCPRWLATIEAVERLLARVPERVGAGPCEAVPDHWGGEEGVDDHAERLGWQRVSCGSARNRFWIVPSNAP